MQNQIRSGDVRRLIIEESYRAGVGHIGSALSVADILAALYGGVINAAHPDDPDRDRFVMSKGHAALALYSVLALKGWLSREDLQTYCADETLLGVHPDRAVPGIDFSTGSLGHGLSLGAGAALAARMQGSSRRAFVLCSDAECNEGSLWEAAAWAGHHRLANLIAIVDLNGQQAFGYTKDVLRIDSMLEPWKSFGWDVREVDGHDIDQLTSSLDGLRARRDRPRVVIARTVFGKGVSFMQSQIKWHYLPMDPDQYERALEEIDPDEA